MTVYKADMQTNKTSTDGCLLSKVEGFQHYQVEPHDEQKHNIIRKHPLITPCDREVRYHDRYTDTDQTAIMFGSTDYLGMITNHQVIEKTVEAVRKYGVGSGGVPALSGTTICQKELEDKLSSLTGMDDSVVFSSGFTANLGAILGLIRPNNLIIQDKLNHASLMDGAVMSGAKMLRYKHGNVEELEKILKENYEQYKDGILVITDGVFSMDGDIAKIPEILPIIRKYDALLIIDEAHSTGVIGEKGAGTLSYYNITDTSNIIITGTLSKAMGAIGGYISAQQDIIDYLRIFAKSNLYSAALPPHVCATALEAINQMQTTDVVDRLAQNSAYLRDRLRENGFNILNTVTAVVPIIIPDEYKLTSIHRDLLREKHLFTSCIVPAAVPPKTSRIRINVMAVHTKADMDYLVNSLIEMFHKYNVPLKK